MIRRFYTRISENAPINDEGNMGCSNDDLDGQSRDVGKKTSNSRLDILEIIIAAELPHLNHRNSEQPYNIISSYPQLFRYLSKSRSACIRKLTIDVR